MALEAAALPGRRHGRLPAGRAAPGERAPLVVALRDRHRGRAGPPHRAAPAPGPPARRRAPRPTRRAALAHARRGRSVIPWALPAVQAGGAGLEVALLREAGGA